MEYKKKVQKHNKEITKLKTMFCTLCWIRFTHWLTNIWYFMVHALLFFLLLSLQFVLFSQSSFSSSGSFSCFYSFEFVIFALTLNKVKCVFFLVFYAENFYVLPLLITRDKKKRGNINECASTQPHASRSGRVKIHLL